VSILVFIVAFVLFQCVANSKIPDTMRILSATRDLSIGDVVGAADVAVRTVYVDDNASLYIAEDEQLSLIGGFVAIPIRAGQPILRDTVIAPVGEGSRLSAVLAGHPGYGIFPLPLDLANVVAPNADSFVSGDLVSLTLVISSRPKGIETPTPQPSYYFDPNNPSLAIPSPTPMPIDLLKQAEEAKTYPPLAKDLTPQGIRVISVQGLPPDTTATADQQSTDPAEFVDYTKPKILMLLVKLEDIEPISLALQEGDLVVVSLLASGSDKPTPGFTYWDLEELFRQDREEVLGQ
jgi:hypothetical protein